MTDLDGRRCRASVAWNPLAIWRPWQCENRAKTTRHLPPENRELPVCGVHARARSASEYRPRPGDPMAAAVEDAPMTEQPEQEASDAD